MFFRIHIINILEYIRDKVIFGVFHRRKPQRARIERSHEFEVGALQLIITGEHFGTRDNGNMVTWWPSTNPWGFMTGLLLEVLLLVWNGTPRNILRFPSSFFWRGTVFLVFFCNRGVGLET